MQNLNTNLFKNLDQPLRQIVKLNEETFEKLLNPKHVQTRDPKTLMERNIQIFIDNGNTSLDYMYKLYNILGNSWFNLGNEAQEKMKEFGQRTQHLGQKMENNLKRASENISSRSNQKRSSSSKNSMNKKLK